MAKHLPSYTPNGTTIIPLGSNGFNLLVTVEDKEIIHTYQSYNTTLLQLRYVAGEQQDYSTSGFGCYVQSVDTRTYSAATSRHQEVLAAMFPGHYSRDSNRKAVEGVDFEPEPFGGRFILQATKGAE